MIQQRKKICRLAWKIGLILTMLLFSVTVDWQLFKAQTNGDTTTVTITITEVNALSKLDGDLPPPINCKEADFFAVTMIGTQEKPTAQIDNKDHIYPNWQHTALIQQATGTIPIVVRLYDFDDHFCGSTDHVDINNTDALDLHLTLDLQTCQISGDLTGDCWTLFSSQGTAKDRAFIAFNIKIDAPFPTIRGQLFETGADGSSQPVSGHTVRVINLVTNKAIAQQQTNSTGEFAWFNLRVPENVLIGIQIDECSGPLHCEHATPEILDPQDIPPVDVKPRLVTLPPCAPVFPCTYPTMKFSFRRIPNYVEVHLNSVAGPPVAGSEVYRWKLDGTSDGPWLTNAQGGVSIPDLRSNEQLIAMSSQYTQTTDSQVHDFWAYKIYITSMIIGVDGKAQLFTVPESTAIHKLVIAPNQTLVSFNLIVSVEGDTYSVDDANNASVTTFLDRLAAGLMNANRFLFDVTDGQFVFGKITIFDGARHWHEADIRIAASNRVRPHTVMGGEKPSDDPFHYRTPGAHVLLGRFWNRYGTVSANADATTTLDNPDGWRVLVHEFLHYAIGLLDEYFVINEATGEMTPALCTKKPDQEAPPHENYLESTLASIMAWPYDASEVDSRHARDFSPGCQQTQHFQVYQESAWETIVRHYTLPPGPYQGRWQIKPATGEHALPGPELPPLLVHKAQPIKVAPSAAERDIYRLATNQGEITFRITLAGAPVATDEVQLFLLKHYGNRTLKTVIDQGTVTKEGIITVSGIEKEAGDQILAISADGRFAQSYEYTNSLTPMIELALEPTAWSPIITVDPLPDGADTTRSLMINVDIGSAVALTGQITVTLIPMGNQAPPQDFVLTTTPGTTRYRLPIAFADTPWRQAHILVQAATSELGRLQAIATYSADDDAPGSHARAYIDASSQNGACNLHFPDNAFPVSVRSKLFNIMQWSLNTPPLPSTGEGNFTISQACYFSPSKAITPGVKGTLVLYFDRQFLTNLDTSRLRIYRWDRDLKAGEWIPVDRINNENYYVAAPIEKPGLYVVAVAGPDNMNQNLFLPLVTR